MGTHQRRMAKDGVCVQLDYAAVSDWANQNTKQLVALRLTVNNRKRGQKFRAKQDLKEQNCGSNRGQVVGSSSNRGAVRSILPTTTTNNHLSRTFTTTTTTIPLPPPPTILQRMVRLVTTLQRMMQILRLRTTIPLLLRLLYSA